ncbi:MAG: deoxyribodipyrimidine photo-lyase, partial [Paracoccaceae bacterium]
MSQAPILLWFRRDLRLDDHPALSEAALSARPVIPVFIHDESVESLGAAPKWRLGLGLEAFAGALERLGTRLILRRGRASEVIDALISETGAGAVFWTRYYEPSHIARDRVMKADLAERGIEARSFAGALLFEPKDVTTGAGTPYSVFTPFWRSVRARDPGRALPTPTRLAGPVDWPRSEALADWRMGAAMQRGAAVVLPHLEVGEERALARLDRFFADAVEGYAEGRDFPKRAVTSGL